MKPFTPRSSAGRFCFGVESTVRAEVSMASYRDAMNDWASTARSVSATRTPPAPLAPHLLDEWLLDPSVIFLNHGCFGACPRKVLAVQSRLREELERQPLLFLD